MPVSATASSIGAKLALRTSNRRRTTLLTSARVVASTTQAAYRTAPSRLPVTTTQFAETSRPTSYAAQKAAVSAMLGSIGATRISSTVVWPSQVCSAACTGAASRSGRVRAGSVFSVPITPAILPPPRVVATAGPTMVRA